MTVITPENVDTFAGLKIDRSTKQPNGLFIALYGMGGAGKTTELAKMTLSEHAKPTLLVDVEGGSSSVAYLKPKGLDVVHATSWREVFKIRQEIEKGSHGYKGVVWDNLSEITNLYKLQVAPSGIPEIQQWGQILATMQEFVRAQRAMTETHGMTVGFCLWEELIENKDTKLLKNAVNLFRGFRSVFPGMVTQVGRLTVPIQTNSEVRLLSFKPDERNDSKFRVSPMEDMNNIPKELWLREDSTVIKDMLALLKENVPFPVEKYAKKREASS